MLKEERQHQILEMLRRDGKVLASQLSNSLNISEDTVRRDLRDLSEARLIQRVHGGALLRAPATASYAVRQKQATTAKAEIARTAARLIQNGQVVILDGGTTTLQLAQSLPHELQATIITTSPPIAIALAEHRGIEVIIIGGRLYRDSMVAVGVETVESLRAFRADLCMLGICSLHTETGISVPVLEEAHTKRAMIASAAEVVALASAEKLNTVAPFIVGPVTELTHPVTEADVASEVLAPYEKLGITIIQGQPH